MVKKVNLDGVVKKVEGITNTIETIMKNRLIIALFLIVDGVTFLLNPDTTLSGMAQNIILIALFATLSVLVANLAAKTKDVRTIVISGLILIVGGFFYFYPDLIAAYIQLLLALFIIFDGVKNIASALHLDKLTNFTKVIAEKYNKIANRKVTDQKKLERQKKFEEVDNNLNNSLEEQKDKLISPLKNIVDKSSKFAVLYITTNVITVMLGVVLLVFPGVSMMVCGLIFLYTGISNLAVSMKSMELSKKIKEKQFKEILLDVKKGEGKIASDAGKNKSKNGR